MPLSGQEKHFADQIDGLLDRVNRIERALGGRWVVADTDKTIKGWLRDYVAMMRANLGPLSESKIEGLYDGIVERILEVESYVRLSDSAPEPS